MYVDDRSATRRVDGVGIVQGGGWGGQAAVRLSSQIRAARGAQPLRRRIRYALSTRRRCHQHLHLLQQPISTSLAPFIPNPLTLLCPIRPSTA